MATNQLKAGAALSYIIIIFNILIGVLYTPLLLRSLGQAEYGLYSLAASVIAYLTLLDLGFGNAITRYTAKYRAEGRQQEQWELFGMFLKMYIGIGAVAMAVGLLLTFNVGAIFGGAMSAVDTHRMRIILILMSLNLAFTFPLSIFGSIITAYENFVFQRVVSLIRIVLNPVVMIILLLSGYKAIALVVVTTLFNLVSLLINWWYCRRRLHIKIVFTKFRWEPFREIFTYSLWIFLNAIMDKIYWSSGQFILGIYKGTATVAIYAVAIQLQQLYMMFSTAISGVFLPRVTSMVTCGADRKDISELFIRTGRIQYIVMAYILTGFTLFGRPFIALWAGADYALTYEITLLLFVPLTVPLIQNMGFTILQAQNRMKFRSVTYVIIAVVSLVASVLLAPRYGAVGCAVATAGALVAGQVVAMNIYYHRKVGIDIPRFWGEIAKMSVVPVLALVTGWQLLSRVQIVTVAQLSLVIAIFSVIYLPLFWLFSMNRSERDIVTGLIKKILAR